jgi:hypothetical protein
MELDFSRVDEKKISVTKEDILSKITPQQIFEFYLGHSVNFDGHILSPLRKERNPSFSFKEYSDGSVIGKDWGTNKIYDCFSFVQELYGLTFTECLKVINNDFSLEKISNLQLLKRNIEGKPKKPSIIQIKKQPFTKADIEYWEQYKITLNLLADYNVHSCKYVWYNGILIRQYSNSNPTYAYEFNSFERTAYKIYNPMANKKTKWLFSGSVTDIEGYDQLPWLGDLLIITKSLKDVLCYRVLGYNAISLQGEQNPLDEDIYDSITHRFNTIIVNYDNDDAGIKGSNRLTNKYGFNSFFIPDELQTKDISDTIKTYGIEYTKDLLNSII